MQWIDARDVNRLPTKYQVELKNELTSPKFVVLRGKERSSENVNLVGERRHEIGYARGESVSKNVRWQRRESVYGY
jgi:hypothetical protein